MKTLEADDLIERLHNWEHIYPQDYDKPEGSLYIEAAEALAAKDAEIARLEKINEQLAEDKNTLLIDGARLVARAEKAEAENEQLKRWQNAVFLVYSNVDLDIEANSEARAALTGEKE